MGQTRTVECERIEEELRAFVPGTGGIECQCQKDTYSEDYIIWVTAWSATGDEVHPIRITVDEYKGEDWKGNVRAALELLAEQAGGR